MPRHLLLLLSLCPITVACGGDGGTSSPRGEPETPGFANVVVSPDIDRTQTSSVTLGRAGGQVELTVVNGPTFVLEVPLGALGEETTITLSAVSDVANLPLSELVAAVTLEPSGLTFSRPARLSIILDTVAARTLVGFRWSGPDDEFAVNRWSFDAEDERVVHLPVEHFSGYGVGNLEEAQLDDVISDLVDQYGTDPTLTEVCLGTCSADAWVQILLDWYQLSVEPSLNQASDLPSSIEAHSALASWYNSAELAFAILEQDIPASVGMTFAQGLELNRLNWLDLLKPFTQPDCSATIGDWWAEWILYPDLFESYVRDFAAYYGESVDDFVLKRFTDPRACIELDILVEEYPESITADTLELPVVLQTVIRTPNSDPIPIKADLEITYTEGAEGPFPTSTDEMGNVSFTLIRTPDDPLSGFGFQVDAIESATKDPLLARRAFVVTDAEPIYFLDSSFSSSPPIRPTSVFAPRSPSPSKLPRTSPGRQTQQEALPRPFSSRSKTMTG